MQSLPQARLWRARATLAQAGLVLRARAVVSTPDPEAAPIRAQAAEPTQGQVAVHIQGRAVALRLLRVAGAIAGLAVVAPINGIGLILIVRQSR